MIPPLRLKDDSCNFYDNISSTILPEIYRHSLVRRPAFSLVRLLVRSWPYRVVPAAGESFGAHICPVPCSLCHLMPSHVHPYPPWSSSKCRNTPSTNQLHVFAFQVGRSVWQGLPGRGLPTSALLPPPNFSGRVGTLGIDSILSPISSNFLCGYHLASRAES